MKLLEISVLILTVLCIEANQSSSQLWRKVIVDQWAFDNNPGSILQTSLTGSSIMCGMACHQLLQCQAFCHDGTTCTLTSIMVSPLHDAYAPPYVGTKWVCFTSLESDYVMTSSVTATPAYDIWVVDRLLKGLYNGEHGNTCYAASGSSSPWLLFDFGAVQTIHEVRVRSHEIYFDYNMPHGLEVKLGNSPPPSDGDFSSYAIFGTLPNPAQELTTYTLKQPAGISGRYLSLQKPQISTGLEICYVYAI